MSRCRSQSPDLWTIECQLERDHDGLHRNNMVTWSQPQVVLVGGVEPDPTVNTDHWVDGEVRLTGDAT